MIFRMESVNLVYDIGKEAETYALKDINLSLDGDRFIGIMGPSGSGKSSLLYALAGFKIPTSGKVSYKDIDYNKIPPSESASIRRRDFGFIFQRHFLIEYMTVLENVLVPINDDSRESKEKAVSILGDLGLAHLVSKKPYQLSGGQRQRVAIARALIGDPRVIFADEPTAALDCSGAIEVMKFLQEYKKDKMIIVVTHDHSILKNANYVINMFDGAIASIDKGGGGI